MQSYVMFAADSTDHSKDLAMRIAKQYSKMDYSDSPSEFGMRVSMQYGIYNHFSEDLNNLKLSDMGIFDLPSFAASIYWETFQINFKNEIFGYLAGFTLRWKQWDFNSGFFFDAGSTWDFTQFSLYPKDGVIPENGKEYKTVSGMPLYDIGANVEYSGLQNGNLGLALMGRLIYVDPGLNNEPFSGEIQATMFYKFRAGAFNSSIGLGLFAAGYPFNTFEKYDHGEWVYNTSKPLGYGVHIFLEVGLHFLHFDHPEEE